MAEREWREATDMRPSTAWLAVAFVLALALRCWGLEAGIPFSVGVDEPQIVGRVVTMMKTGDFNPHFFDYPTLYFYVQLVVASVRFMVGALEGSWHSLDQVGPGNFYLWGRAVTAIFGAATILLVYQIGLRWGARHALLAAGLTAVMPNHVRESHYVLTDVPMTFFVALTFLLALRALEKGTVRSFLWAGVAAGLATATKYNGGLALLLPLCAAYLHTPASGTRLQRALVAVGGCLLAFLVAAPYTLLDLPGFLNGFGYMVTAYRGRNLSEDLGWLVYLKHLRLAFGWPGIILACAGLGLGINRAVKGPGHARSMLLVLFPVAYFWLIATRNLIYARYLLPIVPFACLLVAIAIVSGVSLLRRFEIPRAVRTALITALATAALLPPVVTAVTLVRELAKRSTQDVAFEWVMKNIPQDAHIVSEGAGLQFPERRYKVERLARLIDRDYEAHVAAGAEYLIASDQAYGETLTNSERDPQTYAKYRNLFDQAQELVVVRRSDDQPGPELRILKIRREAGGERREGR